MDIDGMSTDGRFAGSAIGIAGFLNDPHFKESVGVSEEAMTQEESRPAGERPAVARATLEACAHCFWEGGGGFTDKANELHGPWGAPSCMADCLESHHGYEPFVFEACSCNPEGKSRLPERCPQCWQTRRAGWTATRVRPA